jgi:hypothetical protein
MITQATKPTEKIQGTTIRISIRNRDRLIERGGKQDSYDDIIERLLNKDDLEATQ